MRNINIFFLLFLLALSSCKNFKSWVATEFMADKVSDGVARLSAQHMSMIVSELTPRFDKAEFTITPSSDPAMYGKGTATWTLENIDINYDNETTVYTNCQGEKGLWKGMLHVKKAQKIMFGRLTGNPEKPVIPEPGSLKIKVKAEASNLSIRFPDKDGELLLENGDISFTARPRLAQNESGMRLAPTPNTRFDKVRLSNMRGVLANKDIEVPLEIKDARLSIQVGAGESDENYLNGSITLFGHEHEVPSDGAGLDPDYDAEKFISTYACKQSNPALVSYQHIPVESKVAPGIAAMTAGLVSALASEIDENSVCGLLSVDAIKNSKLSGKPSEAGVFRTELKHNCVLDFTNYQTTPNCFGQAKLINGRVTVLKAEKTLTGVVVASADDFKDSVDEYVSELINNAGLNALKKRPKPILPKSNQPIKLGLSLKLENITYTDVCVNHGNLGDPQHCQNMPIKPADKIIFKIDDGEVKAELKPLTAKSLDEKSPTHNFCATKTPIGEASLTLKNIQASIDRGGLVLTGLAGGDIAVVRGKLDNRENQLSGSLSISGQLYEFKTPTHKFISLDPSYDRGIFTQSFMSCQKLELTTKEEECRPELGLAANMARLMVLNSGSLLKIAAAKEIPQSFASQYALENSEISDQDKTLTMPALLPQPINLADSSFGLVTRTRDGLNTETKISGEILDLSGTMIREGERLNKPVEVLGLNINIRSYLWAEGLSTLINDKKEIIIRPLVPESTEIDLKFSLKDFQTTRYKASYSEPEPSLIIQSALLNIKAKPYFGIDKRTVNEKNASYSIATPVVKFDEIKIEQAPMIFKGPHMTILFYCEKAMLSAHSGRYKNQGNYVDGTMSIKLISDLSTVPVKMDPEITLTKQALMPDYDQQKFDDSYVGTKYLYEVLNPN